MPSEYPNALDRPKYWAKYVITVPTIWGLFDFYTIFEMETSSNLANLMGISISILIDRVVLIVLFWYLKYKLTKKKIILYNFFIHTGKLNNFSFQSRSVSYVIRSFHQQINQDLLLYHLVISSTNQNQSRSVSYAIRSFHQQIITSGSILIHRKKKNKSNQIDSE